MLNNLPTTPNPKLISISAAAKYLEVSIDTVRRWDKTGILHSTRPDGKNRHFSLDELEQVKFSRPLTISEAAHKLGISMSTLRRLEKKGMIASSRDKNGERMYTHDSLEKFLKSDYFLRQKSGDGEIAVQAQEDVGSEVQESEPEPEAEVTQTESEAPTPVVFDVQETVDGEQKTSRTTLFFIAMIVLSAAATVVGVVVFPQAVSHILSYQTVAVPAGEIAAATWGFSGRSLATFGSQTSAVQGLTFVFVAGFVGVALFMRFFGKKDQPAPVLGSRVNLGTLVTLILSINLGLVGGLATSRVVQRAEAKVQVQDNANAVLGTEAPKSSQQDSVPASSVTITVPKDSYVNVHREPNRKAEVVIQITQTAQVTKLGQIKGWVNVKTPLNEEGWVSEEFTKDKP